MMKGCKMLMNQSLGICEWCAPVQGPSLFHALKACGIGNFQVDTGLYEAGVPMAFQEVRESYLAAAADAGMELSSASNMSLCDYGMSQPKGSEHYDACKEIMEKSIRTLGAMQIPIFMVPSFFDGEITDEDSFHNTAEMLIWASKLAADNGVTISWENALTVEGYLSRIVSGASKPARRSFSAADAGKSLRGKPSFFRLS